MKCAPLRIAGICFAAMLFIAMPGWANDCGCGGGGSGTVDDTSSSQDSHDGGSSSGYGSAGDPAAYASKARDLMSHGLYEEALLSFNESLAMDPYNTPALLGKGDVLFSLQRYPDAIQVYRKVLEINPSSDDAYLCIGNAYLVMKDYREAADAYERVLSIQPGNAPALENLQVALMHLDGTFATTSPTTLPTATGEALQGAAVFPPQSGPPDVPATHSPVSPLSGVIAVLALVLVLAGVLPGRRRG